MTTLRPYQQHMIDECAGYLRAVPAHRAVLLQGSTGMGKGVVFDALIARAVAKGKRVLFISHRKEINDQISRMLDRRGIDHGICARGHWRRRPELLVQVASIQMLGRATTLPPADMLLVDEAHHMAAGQYAKVMGSYPNAVLIGASATPERLDGRGLGDVFTAMVCAPSMSELVAEGFLLPFRVYAPDTPDLRGVAKVAGDYNSKQLQAAISAMPHRIGKVAHHYRDKANGAKAIAFCVSIEDARAVAAQLCSEGIPAEHVDGTMSTSQRDAALARLRDGVTQIVTNVQLWTEGVDVPIVNCVILLRPTDSLGLYLQQVGRAARPFPGQSEAIVLDHAGCVYRHGLPTQDRQWSLQGRVRRKRVAVEHDLMTCPKCMAVRPRSQPRCLVCSAQQTMFEAIPVEVDGELVEIDEASFEPRYARRDVPPGECVRCGARVQPPAGRAARVRITCSRCLRRTMTSQP